MAKFFQDACKIFFDRWAPDYDDTLEQYRYQVPEELFAAVWPLLEKRPGIIRLLDLGIGTGLCSQPFRKTGRVHITGVDHSASMLEQCQRKGIADEVICRDVRQGLPLDRGRFDCVIAGGIMEFLGKPVSVFGEVARLLGPDGIFAVTSETTATRDLYKPRIFSGIIAETPHQIIVRRAVRGTFPPRTYRKYLYSRETMEEFLFEAGFEVQAIRQLEAYRWSEEERIAYSLFVSRNL